MPSKLYDPTKPTFYLDQSTLSYAFKGEGPFTALQAWVRRVAEEANLCISLAHVFELVLIEDEEKRRAMAAWLDTLHFVPCHLQFHIKPLEADYWLKKAVGIEPARKVLPFVPALALTRDGFMWWGHSFVEMLDLGRDELRLLSEKMRVESLVHVDELQDDTHAADKRKWSKSRRQQQTAFKRRRALRLLAQEAHQRLVESDDPEYAGRAGTSPMRHFERYVLGTPKALPCLRVSWAFLRQYRHVVAKLKPGTPGYLAHKSGLSDRTHLLGAAYCDVFTCDGLVSTCLGDVRTKLGFRHPQITLKGKTPEAFVAALAATWPPPVPPDGPSTRLPSQPPP